MKLVAVVPTVERQDLCRQLIASIKATAPDLPAVFVVMGSDDGTAGYVRNAGCETVEPGATVPPGEPPARPLHFAAAVNLGAATALANHPDADWLLLLNNDVTLLPDWQSGLAFMDEHHFDVVGAKLIYPPAVDDVGKIQHYGKMLTLDFWPFHVLRGQPESHPRAQVPWVCPDVTFAMVAIRPELWQALGGLDEGYVNGYEDDDWCMRAREMGAAIGVHPSFRGIHLESQTTGKDAANKDAQWLRFKEQWVDSGRIQWPMGVYQDWRKV